MRQLNLSVAVLLSLQILSSCHVNDVDHDRHDRRSSVEETAKSQEKTDREYYNKLKDELFSCDREVAGSTEPSVAAPASPSVLYRVISHSGDELSLDTKDLKILVRELSILGNEGGFYFIPYDERRKPGSVTQQLEAIKDSGYAPANVKVAQIKDAINKFHEKFPDGDRKTTENALGEQYLEDLGFSFSSSGAFSSIWHTYVQMLALDFLGKKLRDSIAAGFFVDEQLAWSMVANFSPVLRKLLQRAMSKLKEETLDEKRIKQAFLSMLLSHSFTPDDNDLHVKALKKELGGKIKVSGLAKASVGVVYLVSCHKNNKSRRFVVKTGVYSKKAMQNKLDNELGKFESGYDLAKLYPELATEAVPHGGTTQEKEKHRKKLVAAIEGEILNELDFTEEAKNLRILQKSYDGVPNLKVVRGMPWSIDTEDYLFMELAEGKVLSKVDRLIESQARSLSAALKSLYEHIMYQKGPYHADTHEGNVILSDDGVVTLIDAGRINDAVDDSLIPFLHGFEVGLEYLKSMHLDRSGSAADKLFSAAQKDDTIKKIKSAIADPNTDWSIKTKRAFLSQWEIFFDNYEKGMHVPFREYLINKMSFISGDKLAPVTKALRAIQLIDNIQERLVAPHGIPSFIGKHLKTKRLD